MAATNARRLPAIRRLMRRGVEQAVAEIGDQHQIVVVEVGQPVAADVGQVRALGLEQRIAAVPIDEPRLDQRLSATAA